MFIEIQNLKVNKYAIAYYRTTTEERENSDGTTTTYYCIYYQTTGGRELKDEFLDKADFDTKVALLEAA